MDNQQIQDALNFDNWLESGGYGDRDGIRCAHCGIMSSQRPSEPKGCLDCEHCGQRFAYARVAVGWFTLRPIVRESKPTYDLGGEA
jgi:hypothetical protein